MSIVLSQKTMFLCEGFIMKGFSGLVAGSCAPYELFEGFKHFSAFMIPVAGAPKRQHTSVVVFFLLSRGPK